MSVRLGSIGKGIGVRVAETAVTLRRHNTFAGRPGRPLSEVPAGGGELAVAWMLRAAGRTEENRR